MQGPSLAVKSLQSLQKCSYKRPSLAFDSSPQSSFRSASPLKPTPMVCPSYALGQVRMKLLFRPPNTLLAVSQAIWLQCTQSWSFLVTTPILGANSRPIVTDFWTLRISLMYQWNSTSILFFISSLAMKYFFQDRHNHVLTAIVVNNVLLIQIMTHDCLNLT